jgi:hypothetical protein
MTFEVAKSRNTVDEWRVEAIDFEDEGQVYVALFSGPLARERAEEYATWKNEGEARRSSKRRVVRERQPAHA